MLLTLLTRKSPNKYRFSKKLRTKALWVIYMIKVQGSYDLFIFPHNEKYLDLIENRSINMYEGIEPW